jgi:hypothetical protein
MVFLDCRSVIKSILKFLVEFLPNLIYDCVDFLYAFALLWKMLLARLTSPYSRQKQKRTLS